MFKEVSVLGSLNKYLTTDNTYISDFPLHGCRNCLEYTGQSAASLDASNSLTCHGTKTFSLTLKLAQIEQDKGGQKYVCLKFMEVHPF